MTKEIEFYAIVGKRRRITLPKSIETGVPIKVKITVLKDTNGNKPINKEKGAEP